MDQKAKQMFLEIKNLAAQIFFLKFSEVDAKLDVIRTSCTTKKRNKKRENKTFRGSIQEE